MVFKGRVLLVGFRDSLFCSGMSPGKGFWGLVNFQCWSRTGSCWSLGAGIGSSTSAVLWVAARGNGVGGCSWRGTMAMATGRPQTRLTTSSISLSTTECSCSLRHASFSMNWFISVSSCWRDRFSHALRDSNCSWFLLSMSVSTSSRVFLCLILLSLWWCSCPPSRMISLWGVDGPTSSKTRVAFFFLWKKLRNPLTLHNFLLWKAPFWCYSTFHECSC